MAIHYSAKGSACPIAGRASETAIQLLPTRPPSSLACVVVVVVAAAACLRWLAGPDDGGDCNRRAASLIVASCGSSAVHSHSSPASHETTSATATTTTGYCWQCRWLVCLQRDHSQAHPAQPPAFSRAEPSRLQDYYDYQEQPADSTDEEKEEAAKKVAHLHCRHWLW